MGVSATAMEAFTATARGLPTPRPMPTTAMLVLATAMEAMVTAAFTATASGQLMPSPTMDTDTAVSATAMAATVWVTPTASKTACLRQVKQPAYYLGLLLREGLQA